MHCNSSRKNSKINAIVDFVKMLKCCNSLWLPIIVENLITSVAAFWAARTFCPVNCQHIGFNHSQMIDFMCFLSSVCVFSIFFFFFSLLKCLVRSEKQQNHKYASLTYPFWWINAVYGSQNRLMSESQRSKRRCRRFYLLHT